MQIARNLLFWILCILRKICSTQVSKGLPPHVCNFTIPAYLLSIAWGASRDILLVWVDTSLASPYNSIWPWTLRQHGAHIVEYALWLPGDAAARVGALWSPVSAASQQEAGLHWAEVKEGEISAARCPAIVSNIRQINIYLMIKSLQKCRARATSIPS